MANKALITFFLLFTNSMIFCQVEGTYRDKYNNKIELFGKDSIAIIDPILGRLDTTYGTYTVSGKVMKVKYHFYDFELAEIPCKGNNNQGITFYEYECPSDKININDKAIQVSFDQEDFTTFFIPFSKITAEKTDTVPLNINFKCNVVTFDEKFLIDANQCYSLRIYFDEKSFDIEGLSEIIIKNKKKLIVKGVVYKINK